MLPPNNPQPGSQRASTQSRWWVVVSKFGIQVQQSPTRPAFTRSGPYMSKSAADQQANNLLGQGFNPSNLLPWNWASNWIKGLGGQLASGIESGFVSVFKDLWNVIVGPIEVIIGVIIIVVTLVIYFKDDIAALAPMLAMAAA